MKKHAKLVIILALAVIMTVALFPLSSLAAANATVPDGYNRDYDYDREINRPVVFIVTYTDGVEGEEVFADQVYYAAPLSETPAFVGTPARKGFTFVGWTPIVNERVTDSITYTAMWRSGDDPSVPKTGSSSATALWIALIAAAAISLAAVAVVRKQNDR